MAEDQDEGMFHLGHNRFDDTRFDEWDFTHARMTLPYQSLYEDDDGGCCGGGGGKRIAPDNTNGVIPYVTADVDCANNYVEVQYTDTKARSTDALQLRVTAAGSVFETQIIEKDIGSMVDWGDYVRFNIQDLFPWITNLLNRRTLENLSITIRWIIKDKETGWTDAGTILVPLAKCAVVDNARTILPHISAALACKSNQNGINEPPGAILVRHALTKVPDNMSYRYRITYTRSDERKEKDLIPWTETKPGDSGYGENRFTYAAIYGAEPGDAWSATDPTTTFKLYIHTPANGYFTEPVMAAMAPTQCEQTKEEFDPVNNPHHLRTQSRGPVITRLCPDTTPGAPTLGVNVLEIAIKKGDQYELTIDSGSPDADPPILPPSLPKLTAVITINGVTSKVFYEPLPLDDSVTRIKIPSDEFFSITLPDGTTQTTEEVSFNLAIVDNGVDNSRAYTISSSREMLFLKQCGDGDVDQGIAPPVPKAGGTPETDDCFVVIETEGEAEWYTIMAGDFAQTNDTGTFNIPVIQYTDPVIVTQSDGQSAQVTPGIVQPPTVQAGTIQLDQASNEVVVSTGLVTPGSKGTELLYPVTFEVRVTKPDGTTIADSRNISSAATVPNDVSIPIDCTGNGSNPDEGAWSATYSVVNRCGITAMDQTSVDITGICNPPVIASFNIDITSDVYADNGRFFANERIYLDHEVVATHPDGLPITYSYELVTEPPVGLTAARNYYDLPSRTTPTGTWNSEQGDHRRMPPGGLYTYRVTATASNGTSATAETTFEYVPILVAGQANLEEVSPVTGVALLNATYQFSMNPNATLFTNPRPGSPSPTFGPGQPPDAYSLQVNSSLNSRLPMGKPWPVDAQTTIFTTDEFPWTGGIADQQTSPQLTGPENPDLNNPGTGYFAPVIVKDGVRIRTQSISVPVDFEIQEPPVIVNLGPTPFTQVPGRPELLEVSWSTTITDANNNVVTDFPLAIRALDFTDYTNPVFFQLYDPDTGDPILNTGEFVFPATGSIAVRASDLLSYTSNLNTKDLTLEFTAIDTTGLQSQPVIRSVSYTLPPPPPLNVDLTVVTGAVQFSVVVKHSMQATLTTDAANPYTVEWEWVGDQPGNAGGEFDPSVTNVNPWPETGADIGAAGPFFERIDTCDANRDYTLRVTVTDTVTGATATDTATFSPVDEPPTLSPTGEITARWRTNGNITIGTPANIPEEYIAFFNNRFPDDKEQGSTVASTFTFQDLNNNLYTIALANGADPNDPDILKLQTLTVGRTGNPGSIFYLRREWFPDIPTNQYSSVIVHEVGPDFGGGETVGTILVELISAPLPP